MASSPTGYSLMIPDCFVFLAALIPFWGVSTRVCGPDSASSLCSRVGYVPSHKIQLARPLQLLSLGYAMPPLFAALVARHQGIVLQQSCPSPAIFLPLVPAIVSLSSLLSLSTRLVPRSLSRHVLETVSGNALGSRYNDSESLSSLHCIPLCFQDLCRRLGPFP